jgi:hypothetical protein
MIINENRFKVAVEDSSEFIAIMNDFNSRYKTDFKVENTDFWDGVEFVFINFNNATLDEIFLLGSAYQGSYLRKPR